MKKSIIILGVIISLFAITAKAEKKVSHAEAQLWGLEALGKGVHRMPAKLPIIDIICDSETRTVEISCDEDYDAVVWLYDMEGNIAGSSDILNTILYIPYAGSNEYSIRIESPNWYATANISF